MADVTARAAADAAALDALGLGVRIETDGKAVADVADLVIRNAGWPRFLPGVGAS